MLAKIRGIFATALTKLLLNLGVGITQPSDILAKRFKLEKPVLMPPDLVIKDSPRRKYAILIIGFPSPVNSLLKLISEHLPDIIVWKYIPNIYSVYKGKILEVRGDGYIVNLGDSRGFLPGYGHKAGDEVIATVVKPGYNMLPRLGEKIVISGRYMRLISGENKVFLSEHIRGGAKRKELINLGFLVKPRGWGLRWRSSAMHASFEELMNEANRLNNSIEELLGKIEKANAPCKLIEGEALVEVLFTYKALSKLDEIRSSVIDTLPRHHYLKGINEKGSLLVDFCEKRIAPLNAIPANTLSEIVLDEISGEWFYKGCKARIVHETLDGKNIIITGTIIDRLNRETFVIKRDIKKSGLYDGLNVAKRPGDYVLTLLKLWQPAIVHLYYSKDGTLKGIYCNLNTPVIIHDINTFMYVDLEVDVVKKPGCEPHIVDLEKLEKALEKGIITKTLANKARKNAEFIKEILESHEINSPEDLNNLLKRYLLI